MNNSTCKLIPSCLSVCVHIYTSTLTHMKNESKTRGHLKNKRIFMFWQNAILLLLARKTRLHQAYFSNNDQSTGFP